ncbi:MAG: PorT family protein [Flavisolibacter sp.]|nr:PorT family protein [Flavisolibacter sp.]
MKTKFVALGILSLISTGLFAQTMKTTTTAGSTTFGLRAGVNFQNINGKNASGAELKNSLMTGFHAGVNAEIPVGTGSYLQPGMLFSKKGTELKSTNEKVKLNYIEVPLNFIYKPALGTGNLLLGFGPYVGFGIGGKVERAGNNDGKITYTKTVNETPSLTAGQYKSFDAGGNLLAGYQFANGVSFQLNTQLGLVNINPEYGGAANDQIRWRNTGFGLSLGYRLGSR